MTKIFPLSGPAVLTRESVATERGGPSIVTRTVTKNEQNVSSNVVVVVVVVVSSK